MSNSTKYVPLEIKNEYFTRKLPSMNCQNIPTIKKPVALSPNERFFISRTTTQTLHYNSLPTKKRINNRFFKHHNLTNNQSFNPIHCVSLLSSRSWVRTPTESPSRWAVQFICGTSIFRHSRTFPPILFPLTRYPEQSFMNLFSSTFGRWSE